MNSTWNRGVKRPVAKIDSSLQVVAVYGSCREAALANSCNHGTISRRCNNLSAKPVYEDGFEFAWEDSDESIELAKERMRKSIEFFKVAKIDKNGDVIGLYKTASQGAKANGFSRKGLYKHLNNKTKSPFAKDGYAYADFSNKNLFRDKIKWIKKINGDLVL